MQKNENEEKKEEVLSALKPLLTHFKKTYVLSQTDLINLITEEEEFLIPLSVFSSKLGPLQALVKYLKEELNLRYNKIASLLNRDNKVIWVSYKEAKKKLAERFKLKDEPYFIPVSVFGNIKLSILENLVCYMKEKGISHTKISKLLNRKTSTVFTAYSRAKKKSYEKK